MAQHTTIYGFKQANPDAQTAIQFICVSSMGEIHQIIVSVEDYHREVKSIMTSYQFINDWFVHSHTILIV